MYDWQIACTSVITMGYQVRNLDYSLKFQLTGVNLTVDDMDSEHNNNFQKWL